MLLKGRQLVRNFLLATIVLGLWGPPGFRTAPVSSIELIRGGLDQSALMQMTPFFIAAGLIYVFILNLMQKGTIRTEYIKGLGNIYMGFGCFALFSTLISVFPMYTVYKASILLISFAVVFVYFTYYGRNWYDLWLLFIIYNCIIAFNNLLFFFIDPDSVSMGTRLIGGKFFLRDFGGAGALLLLLGFAMLMFSNLRFLKNILSFFVFSIGVMLVYLSETRSVMYVSIGQMMVVTAITIIWGKKVAKPFIVLILFALVAWYYWGHLFDILIRHGDSLNTLSGRTLIWHYYISYFLESPLFGRGYAAASREIAFLFVTKTGAHSGWIQILVGTGVMGAVIVLSLVFVAIKYGLKLLKIAVRNREISDMERVLIITLSTSIMHWPLDPPFGGDTFPCMLKVSIILFSLRAAYLRYVKCKPISREHLERFLGNYPNIPKAGAELT